ncbi:MAG: hypothetical protein HPY83_08125 [Anaerolineae bacterium]|nr:hypothetical protein [Anaerolineae bacterium]
MDEEGVVGEHRSVEAERTDSWQEVGEQFRLAGRRMAQALRAAWESEANRRGMQTLEESLESLSRDVGQIAKEVASTPEAEQVRVSVEKVAQTARAAGSQALDELRPRLVAALRQLNAELDALIQRLEAKEQRPPLAERIPIEGPPGDAPVAPVQAVKAPGEEAQGAPPEEQPSAPVRARVRRGRPIAEVDQAPWWSVWTRRA